MFRFVYLNVSKVNHFLHVENTGLLPKAVKAQQGLESAPVEVYVVMKGSSREICFPLKGCLSKNGLSGCYL